MSLSQEATDADREFGEVFQEASRRRVLLIEDFDVLEAIIARRAETSAELTEKFRRATALCRRRLADPPQRPKPPTGDDWTRLVRSAIRERLIQDEDLAETVRRVEAAKTVGDLTAEYHALSRQIERRRARRAGP